MNVSSMPGFLPKFTPAIYLSAKYFSVNAFSASLR